MTTYQERFNYALEIEKLKTQLKNLETKLREEQEREFNDPVRTFEVILQVKTRGSTWGINGIDEDVVYNHFLDFIDDIKEVTNLVDEDDSIKVQRATEVKTNGNDT